MSAYPPNIVILHRPELKPDYEPPEREERLAETSAEHKTRHNAAEFPASYETAPPEELAAKLYGCSGSMESERYLEATQYRAIRDMDWGEARLALNRLISEAKVRYSRRMSYPTIAECLALAEFALTASSFDFAGKKGEAAPKFRNEVSVARNLLANQLSWRLKESAANVEKVAGPIITPMMHPQYERNDALWAMVPLPDGQSVMIRDMTPEQALASLDYMRCWLADRAEPRAFAENIVARLRQRDEVTGQQYASATSFVTAAEFISAKLGVVVTLRQLPATRERRLPRKRDMGMLGSPNGFEAALLERDAERAGRH